MRSLAVTVAIALVGVNFAHAQHRDVEVLVESGRLVTGVVDFDQPGNPVTPGVRVFSGVFGEAPNLTDDPGFNAKGNTVGNPLPFAPGTLIGFDLVDALRLWDGSGFDTIPIETVTIFLGFNPDITTPPTPDGFVAGFNFASAGSTGGFHQHFNYYLDAPHAPGVYRLALRLRTNAGHEPSDPVYIILRQGNTPALIEAQQAAVDYMNSLLNPPAFCAGDANNDGVVDFNDITAILANWLNDYTPNSGVGDANDDGVVDFNDITSVLANWLGVCD